MRFFSDSEISQENVTAGTDERTYMKVQFDYLKTYIRLAMVLVIGFSTLCASGQDQELSRAGDPKPAKRLIGDYSYSSRTQTPPYSSEQIPYAKLTHIIHFCLGFYSDGSLYIAGAQWPSRTQSYPPGT